MRVMAKVFKLRLIPSLYGVFHSWGDNPIWTHEILTIDHPKSVITQIPDTTTA